MIDVLAALATWGCLGAGFVWGQRRANRRLADLPE